EGRKLRALPLQPRLARMVVDAAAEGAGMQAASIAAGLTERGLRGGDGGLGRRARQLLPRRPPPRGGGPPAMKRRGGAAGAGGGGGRKETGEHSPGSLLALAYPDRVAKNRGGGGGTFLLANGRGGAVDPAFALEREPFLVVAELTGAAAAGRIVLAAPIALAD